MESVLVRVLFHKFYGVHVVVRILILSIKFLILILRIKK